MVAMLEGKPMIYPADKIISSIEDPRVRQFPEEVRQ